MRNPVAYRDGAGGLAHLPAGGVVPSSARADPCVCLNDAVAGPPVVAVVGYSGAGKSTFADSLAQFLHPPVAVVRQDWFLIERARRTGPGLDDKFDFAELHDVVERLRAGLPVGITPFDPRDRVRSGRLEVQPGATLVVEGITVLRSPFPLKADLRIFVDAPLHVRRARQLARLDELGWYRSLPREQVVAEILARSRTEDPIVARQRRWCDWIVNTSGGDGPPRLALIPHRHAGRSFRVGAGRAA